MNNIIYNKYKKVLIVVFIKVNFIYIKCIKLIKINQILFISIFSYPEYTFASSFLKLKSVITFEIKSAIN